MRVIEVLKRKQIEGILTIGSDASVRDLLEILAEYNVGALVVVDDDALTGIVSERDVVRGIRSDAGILDRPVSAIMTESVRTCAPESPLEDLMALMTEHHIRHVPVVSDGRLLGVISIGDVVKNRMAELEFERDQLDSYVHQT